MSSVFISHSIKDAATASQIAALLDGRGFQSVFLDFDPQYGIPAGRNWEKELYAQLRTCRAIVLLCSPASMASYWCFAEITHARALGKQIIPLKIADCTLPPLLAEIHAIDLTVNRQEGLERLWRGLADAGLDPDGSFEWDARRPPYPGLLAFDEADAAVFFGRDVDIRSGLDVLSRQHTFGGARFIVFLGASGSGKSSLLRAGIVPRLRRDTSKWLVVGTLRPSDEWTHTLGGLLADAFARCGKIVEGDALRAELRAGGGSADALLTRCRDLRIAASRPAANVVIVLDQLEEAFDPRLAESAAALMSVLRATIAAPHSPVLVAATLRSDFFGHFQGRASSLDLAYEQISVAAVPIGNFAQLIEGPAQVAGLELEAGLVGQLVQDAADEDALPLLAFTLRELWERRVDRRMDVATYREALGGLAGSVAHAAEAVLQANAPPEGELASLREALIALVRVNDQGQLTRRPAPADALPAPASRLIERFVQARLLVSRGDGDQRIIEIAHEALFRTWTRLKSWLADDQAFLLWRRRIETAYDNWSRGDTLLRGQLLREAEARRVQFTRLQPRLRQFVEASFAAQRRSRRIAAAGIAAVAAIILSLAAFAWIGEIRARKAAENIAQKSRAAWAAGLVAVARGMANDDPLTASLLLTELAGMEEPTGGVNTARALLNKFVTRTILVGHKGWLTGGDSARAGINTAVFSSDGTRIVTAGNDGTARVFSARTGGKALAVLSGHTREVEAAEFDKTGQMIVTASQDSTARIWSVDGKGEPVVLQGHDGAVHSAHFSTDGKRVVTASRDGTARVWNVDGSGVPIVLGAEDPNAYVQKAIFNRDGTLVLTAAGDGTARIYRADGGGTPVVLGRREAFVTDAAFSPDEKRVLVLEYERPLRIWNADGTGDPVELTASSSDERRFDRTLGATFSPDGRHVATLSDGLVLLWTLQDRIGTPRILAEGIGRGDSVTFTKDGRTLLLVGGDDAAVIDVASGERQMLRAHKNWANSAVFSPDERTILTASADGTARIWISAGAGEPIELRGHKDFVYGATFTPDGRRVITASQDHTTRIFSVDGGAPTELRGAASTVFRVEATRDGARIVAFDFDAIRVWNADGTGEPTILRTPACSILAGALSKDGRRAATGCRDHTVRLWTIGTPGEPVVLGSHKSWVRSVAFSENGGRVLSASEDRTARIWNADGSSKPTILDGNKKEMFKAVWCAGDTRIVTASKDPKASVWSADGQFLFALEGHEKELHDVDCSRDGKWVATASADGTAAVWSAQDGKRVQVFREHDASVSLVRFTRDSKHVVSVEWRGDTRMWAVDGSGESTQLDAAQQTNAACGGPDSDESGLRVVTMCQRRAQLSMIDWRGLVGRLRERTLLCLPAELRTRYLGETAEAARAQFDRCETGR